MDKILCWECNQPSGQHKLSCDSRSHVEHLQYFLDNLHNVPQEILDLVAHKCYVESMERRLAFYEEDEYVEKD